MILAFNFSGPLTFRLGPPIFLQDRSLLFSKLGFTGQLFDFKIFIWNLSAVKKRELIAYLVPNIFASCLVAAGILVQILVLINSRKFILFMGNLVIRSLIINLDSVPYDTIHVRSRQEHVRNGHRSSSERVRREPWASLFPSLRY